METPEPARRTVAIPSFFPLPGLLEIGVFLQGGFFLYLFFAISNAGLVLSVFLSLF